MRTATTVISRKNSVVRERKEVPIFRGALGFLQVPSLAGSQVRWHDDVTVHAGEGDGPLPGTFL